MTHPHLGAEAMTSPNDVAALVGRLQARTFSRWESDIGAVMDYEDELCTEAAEALATQAATIAALQAEVERANEALDTIARGRIGPVSCLGGALAAMQSFAREACRLPAARSASRKENTP